MPQEREGSGGAPPDLRRVPGTGPRGPGGWPTGGPGGGRIAWQVNLPSIDRPPSAQDFNVASTLTARTAANTPAAFPANFQVPANNVAVIKSISILANGLLVTSNIVWALRFNQAAVFGWNALTINPRAAGSVEVSWTPEETAIPVPEGALIDFLVTVFDGGTYQLSVSFHGWFYAAWLAAASEQSGL